MAWALEWIARLETQWPCAAPFVLGLCLSALLRALFLRDMARKRREIMAEVRAQIELAELSAPPPRTPPANGSAKRGSNGA